MIMVVKDCDCQELWPLRIMDAKLNKISRKKLCMKIVNMSVTLNCRGEVLCALF